MLTSVSLCRRLCKTRLLRYILLLFPFFWITFWRERSTKISTTRVSTCLHMCVSVFVCVWAREKTSESYRVVRCDMTHLHVTCLCVCDQPCSVCRIRMGFDSCICCYTAHSWTIVCKRLAMTTCPSWTVPRVTNYILTRDWTYAYVTLLIRKPSCAEIGNADILHLNNTTSHELCNESPTV